MRYRISTAMVIYGGGEPELEPAIAGALAWIEANSAFAFDARIIYSELEPPLRLMDSSHFLHPDDVDWAEVPRAQFPFLLWRCDGVSPCPAYGGACFGFSRYGAEQRIAVPCSAPYDSDFSVFWGSHQGFPTYFEAVMVHEFKNALWAWCDLYGFSILNTYPDGEHIDCARYPEETRSVDCYREFFSQLTPEMYAAVGSAIVPTAGSVRTPLLIGSAVLALGLVASRTGV